MEPGAGRGGGLDRGDGGAWPVRERDSGAGREPSNASSSYVFSFSSCNVHSASAIASAPSNVFNDFAPKNALPVEVDLKPPSVGGGPMSVDSGHAAVLVDSSHMAGVDLSSAPDSVAPLVEGGAGCFLLLASHASPPFSTPLA